MDSTANGSGTSGAAGTQGNANQNLDQLKALFDEFSQTLVKLRTLTTQGQQQIETARSRPQ